MAGFLQFALLGLGVGALYSLASQGLIRMIERDRALWPYAAYRLALAAVIAARASQRAD